MWYEIWEWVNKFWQRTCFLEISILKLIKNYIALLTIMFSMKFSKFLTTCIFSMNFDMEVKIIEAWILPIIYICFSFIDVFYKLSKCWKQKSQNKSIINIFKRYTAGYLNFSEIIINKKKVCYTDGKN